MSRPLVLLPPSKGKAAGGDGPPYAATLAPDHPLTDARRAVLAAAVAAAGRADDATIARVCGVGRDKVTTARTLLCELEHAPTLPAHRRYTGIVHGNAGLAEVDPAAAGADVRIVSALLGLAALDEPVPAYRLELTATLPDVGGLGPYWRRQLADHLREVAGGRRVWDLLPGEHARAVDRRIRAELDVVTVRFVRPDGRAANAARTKVCKGVLTAALLRAPDLDATAFARAVDPGEGWTLAATGADEVTATCTV